MKPFVRGSGRYVSTLGLALGASVLASCTGGGALPTGPSPVAAEVEIRYSTAGAQREASLECNGIVRVYPSWWGFTHQTMIPAGEGEWVALFEDVPVGAQTVRVTTPTGCETGQTRVNGLPIDAEAGELVFPFTVHHDGRVTH